MGLGFVRASTVHAVVRGVPGVSLNLGYTLQSVGTLQKIFGTR